MNIPISIIESIAQKVSWKHLTKDIPNEKLRTGLKSPNKITEPQLHKICQYFQDNPLPNNISLRKHIKNAFDYIGYNNYGEGMLNSIRLMYLKKRFVYISSQYNF